MADAFMRASTELSAIVPELWSSNYYAVLLAELPFRDLISKDWEGEIQDLGDTVHISSIPEFAAATELVEDAKKDAVAITVGSQSLVINKRVVQDFIITRLAQVQSLEHMNKVRDMAVYSIMKKINSTIIATTVPNVLNALAYTVGTTLALVDILTVKERLDAEDVPQGDRHMILGSAQANDIFNITGLENARAA